MSQHSILCLLQQVDIRIPSQYRFSFLILTALKFHLCFPSDLWFSPVLVFLHYALVISSKWTHPFFTISSMMGPQKCWEFSCLPLWEPWGTHRDCFSIGSLLVPTYECVIYSQPFSQYLEVAILGVLCFNV